MLRLIPERLPSGWPFALLAWLAAACGGGDPLPGDPAAGPEAPFHPSPQETATVTRVIDGERLVLADGRQVSLLGVDAPEGDEVCAAEAVAYLKALVSVGEPVVLDVCRTPPPGQPVPPGGVTAFVVVPGRSFVNLEMLRAGRAQFRGTVGACGGPAADARFERGQTEAIEARRGIFGTDACAAPPPRPEPVAPQPGETPGPTPAATPTPAPRPPPAATPPPAQPGSFAGLPVFPGAREVERRVEDDEARATFEAGETLAAVVDFYDRTLREAGWRIDDRKVRAEGAEYRVERGDEKGKVRLEQRGGVIRIRLEVERD